MTDIKLMITDNDGCLTDGTVYYSAKGEEMVRYNRRDGHGFELLRENGIPTIIMTREPPTLVQARAEKLKAELIAGVKDKGDALEALLKKRKIDPGTVAYFGDDAPDLPAMGIVLAAGGVVGLPADADPFTLDTIASAQENPNIHVSQTYICDAKGGEGAFREFAEHVCSLETIPFNP